MLKLLKNKLKSRKICFITYIFTTFVADFETFINFIHKNE